MKTESSHGLRVASGLAKSSTISFFGSFIGNAAEFTTNVILVHCLSKTNYGIYAFGFAVLFLLSAWSSFGTGESLSILLPRHAVSGEKKQFSSIVAASGVLVILMWGLAMAIVTPFGTVLLSSIIPQPEMIAIARFAVLIGAGHVGSVYAIDLLRATRLPWATILVRDGICRLGRLAAVAATVYFFPTPANALIAYSMTGIIALLVAVPIMLRYSDFTPAKISFSEIGHLMRFGWPFMLGELIARLRSRVEILILPVFLSSAQVGIYSALNILASLLLAPISAVNTFFLSYSSDLLSHNRHQDYKDLLGLEGRWLFYFTLPSCMALLMYPGEILAFIFGNTYQAGSRALQLVAVAYLVSSSTASCGLALLAYGHRKVILWLRGLGAASSILCCVFLVPRFSLVGAGLGCLTSQLLINSMSLVLLYRWHRLHPLSWNYLLYGVSSFVAFVTFDFVLSLFISFPILRCFLIVILLTTLGSFGALLTIERRKSTGALAENFRLNITAKAKEFLQFK